MAEYKVTLTARFISYVFAPDEWDTDDVGQAAQDSVRLVPAIGDSIKTERDWIEVEEVFRLPDEGAK